MDSWVSACRVFEVPGDKGRCRGRKTGGDCLDGDMGLLGLKMEWAQDRVKWEGGLIPGSRPTRASM